MSKLKLQVERLLKSSPESVFKAWTSKNSIATWHCGNISEAVMDVRPDGEFRLEFEANEDESTTVSGKYRNVVPNEELVYSWKWNSEEWTSNEWDSLVTVKFAEHKNGTLVQIEHDQLENADQVDSHEEGWNICLDGLKKYLQGSADTLLPPGF